MLDIRHRRSDSTANSEVSALMPTLTQPRFASMS